MMTDDERRKWLLGVKEAVDAELAGKETEVAFQGEPESVWRNCSQCEPFYLSHRYRAKPTPKYRPFTLEESGKLLGRKCKLNSGMYTATLTEVRSDGYVRVRYNDDSGTVVPFDLLAGNYTFADTGLPCGVLAESADA